MIYQVSQEELLCVEPFNIADAFDTPRKKQTAEFDTFARMAVDQLILIDKRHASLAYFHHQCSDVLTKYFEQTRHCFDDQTRAGYASHVILNHS